MSSSWVALGSVTSASCRLQGECRRCGDGWHGWSGKNLLPAAAPGQSVSGQIPPNATGRRRLKVKRWLRSSSPINQLPTDKRRVGLPGAGLEVTEVGTIYPFFKHPKTPLKANPYQLDQTQFIRHQNAPELKQSTKPFTSSAAPGKATRRPAPIRKVTSGVCRQSSRRV